MKVEDLRRRFERPAPPEQSAAVLAALFQTDSGLHLLFEERAAALQRQPGEVCLPGGRMEPGETPVQAALRESWEETGLPPEAVEVLGPLRDQLPPYGRRVYPVVGLVSPQWSPERLCPNQSEVAQLFTVPLDWLAENPPQRYHCEATLVDRSQMPPALRTLTQHYPRPMAGCYWQYGDHIIWGMTARVVLDLVQG